MLPWGEVYVNDRKFGYFHCTEDLKVHGPEIKNGNFNRNARAYMERRYTYPEIVGERR